MNEVHEEQRAEEFITVDFKATAGYSIVHDKKPNRLEVGKLKRLLQV